MVTYKFYTRTDTGGNPFRERTVTNGQGVVVTISNPANQNDIEITEQQYDALQAQQAIDIENDKISYANAQAALVAAAHAKLVGLGLTPEEAMALV